MTKEDFDLLIIPIDPKQKQIIEEASKHTICDGVGDYIVNIMLTVSNGILNCDEVKEDNMKVVGWEI